MEKKIIGIIERSLRGVESWLKKEDFGLKTGLWLARDSLVLLPNPTCIFWHREIHDFNLPSQTLQGRHALRMGRIDLIFAYVIRDGVLSIPCEGIFFKSKGRLSRARKPLKPRQKPLLNSVPVGNTFF
jgi:hypothetical protein